VGALIGDVGALVVGALIGDVGALVVGALIGDALYVVSIDGAAHDSLRRTSGQLPVERLAPTERKLALHEAWARRLAS
jgi:hypothetical protein